MAKDKYLTCFKEKKKKQIINLMATSLEIFFNSYKYHAER